MTLGENLQELRRRSGLSQEEVAGRLFVSRQSVSKWENGQAEPGVENLKALAELYGVSMDELTGMPHRPETAEEDSIPLRAAGPDLREEKAVRFYHGVFAVRTVTLVVLEMMILQGGIKIPFDWLAMLVGLFVRKQSMWWIVQVLLWINVIVNLLNLFQGSAIGAVGLLHAGMFLYAFFGHESRVYFHMEGEGTL